MIPILYEKTETTFTSNGIGRLPDCVSCTVTEELNSGVYECDFQYPVSGDNFSEITLGRIIAVTHDDTGDIQPFDIVSYSKPIDGVVDFHAVHISYRLARYTAKVPNQTVNSIANAFTMFQNAYPQDGLWNYSAPGMGSPTAFMGSTADGLPKSVRQFIGGIEGSFLDTFGGEVTWDKFNVIFKPQRGQARDFTIRYGVNLTGYNEEVEGQETFAYALPYWTDGTNVVVGNLVNSGLTDYDGHELCVALDLSEKFDAAPSVADLTTEATTFMTDNATNVPKQSINVDFVRIQDLAGYEDYSDLLTCELGDSLTVIFPMYNITGTFRIVKVIWDVLRDRFDTMTLGSLQTTLAEALGVTGGMTNVGGGGGGGSVVSFTQVLSSGTKIGIITIDGTSTDIYAPSGGGGGVFYGTCGTAAATAAKAVTCPSFTAADLTAGTVLYVDFTYSNTVASPTLNVNSTGAKDIMRYGTTRPSTSAASSWNAGSIVCMVYDGTYWNIEGWLNTTYSAISQTNIENQSGTSSGLITGQRFTQGLAARLAISQTLASGTEIAEITLNGTATKLYAPSSGLQNTFYGTSSTAAATAIKDVVCSDWLGNYGDIIAVTFTNANTAQQPQLAVNGGTARPIMLNGSTLGATWGAGETVTFMRRLYGGGTPCFEYLSNGNAYALADGKSTVTWNQVQPTGTKIAEITIDGTLTDVYAPTTKNVWYGTATISTRAITATTLSGDFTLTAGNVLILKMGSANATAGVYPNHITIAVDGLAATRAVDETALGLRAYSWGAGELVTFVYDGTYFRLVESATAGSNSEPVWGTSKIASATQRQPTLTTSGWSGGTQTVSCAGVTASNNVIVTYDPASHDAWVAAGVYCSAQATNSLTFTCASTPTANLTANVLIID